MSWRDEYEPGGVIYENPLRSERDVHEFVMEGEGVVSFPLGRMRLENGMDPREGQKANIVYWCPRDFPSNIAITWDFWPIREPGLCIVFFAAKGRNGEDLFDPSLNERTGPYDQYHHGDINAYHVSYFRRKNERFLHLCNLRKSYGFHMVAQGADPIPPVLDARGPYEIALFKYGGHIMYTINDLPILEWHDNGQTHGPVLTDGKIGFRQMAPMIGEYANLTVKELHI